MHTDMVLMKTTVNNAPCNVQARLFLFNRCLVVCKDLSAGFDPIFFFLALNFCIYLILAPTLVTARSVSFKLRSSARMTCGSWTGAAPSMSWSFMTPLGGRAPETKAEAETRVPLRYELRYVWT